MPWAWQACGPILLFLPKASWWPLSGVWRGMGSTSPQGVVQPRAASPPPTSFPARWSSVCSRVLTASRLPGGGPQDCKFYLPAVAEPAEGWAARQAPSAAPGAHASCRLSGCRREEAGLSPDHHDHSLPSKGLQKPDNAWLPLAPGFFPSYLATQHRGESSLDLQISGLHCSARGHKGSVEQTLCLPKEFML